MTDSPAADSPASQEPLRPVLRIVGGGAPSDEELAALVAVLAMRGSAVADGPAPGSRWRGDGWLAAARRGALRPGR